MLFTTLTSVLLLASAPAMLQVSATNVGVNSEGPSSQDTENAEKQICRSFKVTGSRAKRERICMTRAQWIAQEQAAREAGRDIGNSGICADRTACSGG